MLPTALHMAVPAVRRTSPFYPLVSFQRGLCTRVFASIAGSSVSV